jgi:NAD(P)-dependent dehydrogenase (short-subunit alcohol dehydrogenase family)
MELLNKIAVITGAGSGIGRASSLKLASNGAKVVLVDFNQETVEETLRIVKEQGGDGIFVKADVSKTEDVQTYVNKAVEIYFMVYIIYFWYFYFY